MMRRWSRWDRREMPWALSMVAVFFLVGVGIASLSEDSWSDAPFVMPLVNAASRCAKLGAIRAPQSRDQVAEFHADCVAVAEGAMTYEELLDKWNGKVPWREKPKAEGALFREVVSPGYCPDKVRAEMAAAVQKELDANTGPPQYPCRVTLGLHDAPCVCADPAPTPQIEVVVPPRFAPMRWVRVTCTGALGQVHGAYDSTPGGWQYIVETEKGKAAYYGQMLEEAWPLAGETWEWVASCPEEYAMGVLKGPLSAFVVPREWAMSEARTAAVRCGYLRPVNFGKGHFPGAPLIAPSFSKDFERMMKEEMGLL